MKLQTHECNLLIRSKIFSFRCFSGLWSAVPGANIGKYPECSVFPCHVFFFCSCNRSLRAARAWKEIRCLLHSTTPWKKGNSSGISAPDNEIIHSFAALSQPAGVESSEESTEVLSDDLISLMRGEVGHKC